MNKKMIRRYFGDDYKFIDINIGEDLKSEYFDLCILGEKYLQDLEEDIVTIKEQQAPIYLPVILLVSETHLKKYFNTDFGSLYDDILPLPISPQILNSRVKSLLNQRRQSLELKEKVFLANKAINSTDIGICITDKSQEDNPLVYVNKGFEQLTGYSEDEVLGKNCRILQDNDNEQEGIQKLREAIDENDYEKTIIRNYKKDGSLFWNEITISPITNSDGTARYFVGTQNDITELVSIKNDLEELVEEKEVLLQEVHHRIKNNLAVIVALLELKIMNSEKVETVLSLKETRTRIFSISKVHELLYHQDQLNKIQFKDYIKDLVEHLNEVYSDISKKIDFQLDLEQLLISLDQAVPCGMLISELITNVYKHGFEEGDVGKVSLKMKEQAGNMEVRVIDNGKGLPEGKALNDMKDFSHSIIRTLLLQLEADWEAKSGNGFQFMFNFKLKNYAGIVKENINEV
ncbi:PAS domain-containing protein [Halalkalibaculum sp. DA384]|uniref:PAS domain-containing protein n=1 Tax=Halalkalibaculum sp. DA384 TaxID=3373606 RepID=UPI003754AA14